MNVYESHVWIAAFALVAWAIFIMYLALVESAKHEALTAWLKRIEQHLDKELAKDG